MVILSVVFAFIVSVLVFVIFPTVAVNILKNAINVPFVLNLIEGILRMAMFVVYVLAISKMKDIKTLFQYHGAEHKTIHCFENNLEMTPINAKDFPTLHPRCGTSFLMFVFLIALLLFSFLGWPNVGLRILSRLLLLPVIAGISYELLKWAGRNDGKLVRTLSYPGLMMQKITTAEPTLDQLEVAILALKAVLVGPEVPVGEGFVDKNGRWLDDFKEEDFLEYKDDGELLEEDRSIGGALRWGQKMLKDKENGSNEARTILAYAGRLSHADIITRANENMRENDYVEYKIRIKQRLAGKPLQYIVGTQEFYGRPFRVNSSVLIPRLDTEVLVEKCVDILKEKRTNRINILELCTGSGAIGISVAAEIPEALVTMTDVSESALKVAMQNAMINHVAGQCSFQLGDMFEAIPNTSQYDMIICNPPYIESAEIDKLMPEVKDFEPRIALDGGEDGLTFYHKIAGEAARYIKPGGFLVLEIGYRQADAVTKMLIQRHEFTGIKVYKDLAHNDRVVVAERIK